MGPGNIIKMSQQTGCKGKPYKVIGWVGRRRGEMGEGRRGGGEGKE